MVHVKPLGAVCFGGTDIHFAEGIKAGNWLFFTKREAIDFETGAAVEVTCPLGLSHHGTPRYRREHASHRPDLLDLSL